MRLLLISTERVGPEMAAAGIRYVELAAALAAHADVTCLAPLGSVPVSALPHLRTYDPASPASVEEAVASADVVFAPPLVPSLAASIVRAGRRWVVDLLDPEPFEGLEYHKGRRAWERRALATLRADRLSYALRRGSAFVCATERQRDMWLGMLAASRRLDPDRYDRDPQLRDLIDAIPPGVDGTPPAPPARPVLRGVALPADARIVLWNGGIWDWLDPDTAIDAVRLLHARDDRWRLFFMSTGRPGTRPPMAASRRVTSAADEAIRLNREWVPHDERAGYLLEADVCVSAHHATLESRFAYRNRLLDCIWAGLPIVCTEGDSFADAVRERGWGEVVPPEDSHALAGALETVVQAERSSYAASMARYREEHTRAQAAEGIHRLAARAVADPRGPRRLDVVSAFVRARHAAASALRSPG